MMLFLNHKMADTSYHRIKESILANFTTVINNYIQFLETEVKDKEQSIKLQDYLFFTILQVSINYGLTNEQKRILKCLPCSDLSERKKNILEEIMNGCEF